MLDLDFENGLAPDVRAVLTSKLLTDFEFFNRFFFKHIYGRKFLMGAHHHLIAEKMKAVARGDITDEEREIVVADTVGFIL